MGPGRAGAGQVFFDGAAVWSFSFEQPSRSPRTARWPTRMKPWLDGRAHVRVEFEGRTVVDAPVRLGESDEPIRFVDQHGIGVMFDKWGLLQRPFSARPRRVVDEMLSRTELILQIMRDECGLEGWIAFGTLLGAARGGRVIGHDSDVDIAYLSDRTSPGDMTRELWALTRALRRHSLRVVVKSGAFITVVFRSADGGQASIDIYICFYLGELLYETATVRTPMPRSAILPLDSIELEGRRLPAPADVDAVLTASYGRSWRVPDPSFSHAPGPEIKRRFDGWFSSLMRHRRDWETALVNQRRTPGGASGFARWVLPHLAPGTCVVDIGAGTGRDSRFLARKGFEVVALDYARRGTGRTRRRAVATQRPSFSALNLYDYRDVVTRGALLARRTEHMTVYSRDVLDVLDADGVENFWRLVALVLGGGGTLFMETRAAAQDLDRQVERAGGQVVSLERAAGQGSRLMGSWPGRTETHG